MTRSPNKLIPDDFTATPSLDAVPARSRWCGELDERNLDAIGVLVTSDGDLPAGIDLDREALALRRLRGEARHDARAADAAGPAHRARRRGRGGRARRRGPARCGGGLRARDLAVRDASGCACRRSATPDAAAAAQALTEGAVLARYRFSELQAEAEGRRRSSASSSSSTTSIAPRHPPAPRPASSPRAPRTSPATSRTRRPGTSRPTDMADVAVALGLALRVRRRGVRPAAAHRPRLRRPARRERGQRRGAAHGEAAVHADRRVDGPPRPRRQGHHVRLGRHQPEAVRPDAPAHEDGHGRRGIRARRLHRAARPRRHRDRDRLADVHRQHAVGLGLQARRRAHRARRHDRRGEEHRRRGTPRDDGRHRARERGRRRRDRRHRDAHRRGAHGARPVDRRRHRQRRRRRSARSKAAAAATDEHVWRAAARAEVPQAARLGCRGPLEPRRPLRRRDDRRALPRPSSWARRRGRTSTSRARCSREADDSWRSKGATGFGARLLIEVARGFQPAK